MNDNRSTGDESSATSEFVRAPGFGETAPPSPPVPDFVAVPVVAPGTSTSNPNAAIIAVLAFALLVIVGGTVLLLSTGIGTPGADDRTFEPTAAPVDESARTVPAASVQSPPSAAVAVEPDPLPQVTTPPVTVPPSTVPPSTVPPSTVPPSTVPPSTVPPSTVPPSTVAPETRPPTTPAPVAAIDAVTGRGFGDLGLRQPVLAEPCSGGYITFVLGIAGGERPYPDQVQRGLDAFSGSNYVWGGMCPSLRQFNDNGDEIYGVVYGPFASAREACDVEQRFASDGAYVRRLETVDPVGRDDHCG